MVSTVVLPTHGHHFPPGSPFELSRASPTHRSAKQRFEGEGSETPAKIWIKSFASSGLLASKVEAGASSPTDKDAESGVRSRFATAPPDLPSNRHEDTEILEQDITAVKSLEALSRRRLVTGRGASRSSPDDSWRVATEGDESNEVEEILRQASSSSSDEGEGEGEESTTLFRNIFSVQPGQDRTSEKRGSDCSQRSNNSIWQQYDLLEAMGKLRKTMTDALAVPLNAQSDDDSSDAADSDNGDVDKVIQEADAASSDAADVERVLQEGPPSEDEDACPPLPEFRGPPEEVLPATDGGQSSEMVQTHSNASLRGGDDFLTRQFIAFQAFMCCRAKPPKGAVMPRVAR